MLQPRWFDKFRGTVCSEEQFQAFSRENAWIFSQDERIARVGLWLWYQQQQDPQNLARFLAAIDHKLGVKAAVVCARWALDRFWTDKTDQRPWDCIATVERWLAGEATLAEVQAARSAASAAAYAANAAAYAAGARRKQANTELCQAIRAEISINDLTL